MRQVGRWHGWQGKSVANLIAAASGLSGGQSWGLVGPKIEIVGVPIAAETCDSPESLVIATFAAASARIALRRLLPVRSRADVALAATISPASARSLGPPTTHTLQPCCASIRATSA